MMIRVDRKSTLCERGDVEVQYYERRRQRRLASGSRVVGRAALLLIAAQLTLTAYRYVIHAWYCSFGQQSGQVIPTATTVNGTFVGVHNAFYFTDHFLGIPYAQPPVGRLRFNAPQTLDESWSGTRRADEYAKACFQRSSGWDHGQDEDCLALNVIRPANSTDQKLPVAVWIHGGGYVSGATSNKPYNLSFMVQNSVSMGKPIIAVSIAYRLSAFGFLDSRQIRTEGATNLGIRDQRLALLWIQENIAAFGGDPEKVTIWGESAGAGAVGVHLIANDGKDDKLFRSAIGESGSPLRLGQSSETFAQRQAIFDEAVWKTGCQYANNVLDCLREADAEELHQVLRGYGYWPYEDGDLIQGSQHDQMLQGRFIKVPYLLGTNTDEGVMFAQHGINTDAEFEASLNQSGADYEVIKNLQMVYPNIPALGIPVGLTGPLNRDIGLQYKRVAAYEGDWWMTAPRRLAMQQWATYNVPAYSYRFNTIVNENGPWSSVGHFDEVAFVFNNIHGEGYPHNPFYNKPQSYTDLSKIMCRMWIAFIHDGDPNAHLLSDIPHWPLYDNGIGGYGQNFVFTAGSIDVENDIYRATAMAYLNSLWQTQFGK